MMMKVNRRPTHPGIILRNHYLQPRSVSVAELARATGLSRKHISAIVNGNTAITPESAVRIAKVLGTTPELWLNLQNAVTLHDVCKKLRNWRPAAVHSAIAAAAAAE